MAAPTLQNFEMTAKLADLTHWLIQQGLENTPVDVWLEKLCDGLVEAGIQLQRVNLSMRAHHPEIGGVAFRWRREGENEQFTYARGNSDTLEEYKLSPLYYLLEQPIPEFRQRLDVPEPALDFPMFDDLREQGGTEYYALKRSFLHKDQSRGFDPLKLEEGMTISLTTDQQGGFTKVQIDALRDMINPICLTLKCGSNRLMAEELTAAYLGRDASRRVLSGDIMRGSSETISAVIWYFDLQGFTKLSESLPGTAIIDMLNLYFGEAVEMVEKYGGNVLKFMGDGMLAIFDLETVPDAGATAIRAAMELREVFDTLNKERAAEDEPTTGFTLALHAGDVLYGNIGGKTRLDFTVIGPAVNQTARILGMCGNVDQTVVISSHVARPLLKDIPQLVSLGQYRLRGVTERQELFTLD